MAQAWRGSPQDSTLLAEEKVGMQMGWREMGKEKRAMWDDTVVCVASAVSLI